MKFRFPRSMAIRLSRRMETGLPAIDKQAEKSYTFKYSASDEACIAALYKWRRRLGPAQWELRIVSGWEQSSTKQILPCAAGVPGPS